MKQTLLQMTQDILSSMSSDEVNSIGDTTESLQVANIIKQKYFDIVNRVPLPEHEQLIQLDPSLDNSTPVLMYVPDGIANIKWIKYFDSNVADGTQSDDFNHDLNTDIQNNANSIGVAPPGYLPIQILPNHSFIAMVNSFNPTDEGVESFTFTDVSNTGFHYDFNLYYKNNGQPRYCTILSNKYVIFDSFDSSQDSTLQASKTMCFGSIIPQWQNEDGFIPDLAEEQFQLLLNEAKALAFFELKQQPHQLAIQEAQRGWSTIQKNKAITNRPSYFNELPNFGRRSGVYYGTRGFGNGYNQGWSQWQ